MSNNRREEGLMRGCYRGLGKRALDIVLSALALIILSPVALIVAIAIRFTMGRPIIFSQVRPGLYGRPFVMYKFRTMLDLYDEKGNLLPDEMRITRLGKFLRRSSLDEIPEFWNVLKGDMSLVGPRPLLMEYLPLYTKEQARRHEVKPGMTGWAQVNGRNAISWEEKFRFDVWYVDNVSFWIDIKILSLTFWKVLKREGISAPDHVTAPKFEGMSK